MRKKLTAALMALVFVITSIAAGPVTYAKSATTKEDIKSFTKIENTGGETSDPVKKNTIDKFINGKTYAPGDEVTVIVELKEAPLLEHFITDQTTGPVSSSMSESFDDYAATQKAETISKGLLKQQRNVTNRIQSLKTEKNTADVIYNYTSVMNGFAIKVKYQSLQQIINLPEVQSAYIAGSYEKIEPVMDTSTGTIGAVATWDLNLRGEGTIVAILDTGLDTGHIGFQKVPTQPKFTENDIQQRITGSAGLRSGITDASKTYVSAKIPYAYDYADSDTKVTPSALSVEKNGNDHGTHVAGTIAAPAEDGDSITGVAPEAQLMIMKVFSDVIDDKGAKTEDILAALDDTVTLGADVINMSLGSPSGFTYDGDESVSRVYNRIAEAGITLSVSAGNSYSNTYNNGLHGLALSGNTDTAVVGSPSTYAASTSVASVINAKYHSAYFEVNKEKITYSETATGNQPLFKDLKPATGSAIGLRETNSATEPSGTADDTSDTLVSTVPQDAPVVTGAAIEYVPVPGLGNLTDYYGIDVTGKIALVKRGSINFNDKVKNAYANGAIGIVVYNNQPGTINMSITDYVIPAVSITAEDGDKLLQAASKVLKIIGDIGTFPDENANHLSAFSSWGVTPDLKLKPEISAPGENIYSTLPFDKYGSMSGTSMAAPHIAGTFALVKEYLNSSTKFSSQYNKAELANDLLMSTAIPTKNAAGVYYSPRKQGSGIVNVYNAVNTDAYLYVADPQAPNQRPKLNLGDDASKTGVYTKSFHIKSVTGSAITFVPQVSTLTETGDGVYIGETPEDISPFTKTELKVDGVSTNEITVQPEGDVEVTITLTLNNDIKDALNNRFENGEFIDGFVILDSNETPYNLTIPFMGYYGDWTQAPLFDSGSASNLEGYQQNIHALLTDGGNSYLGVNPFDDDAYALIGTRNPYLEPDLYNLLDPMAGPEKIAISPNNDSSFDSLDLAQLSLLRNAKSLDWSITDKANHILASDTYHYESKSIYNPNYSVVVPSYIDNIYWGGTDASGNPLPNNAEVTFKVDGQLDYDGHSQNNARSELTFPVTIDLENPTLAGVTEKDGSIKIQVRDNQYVAAVFLFDKNDSKKPVASCLLDEDTKGATTTININLADLGLAGKTASDLFVTIVDYALNQENYLLDKVPTPTPTEPTPTPTNPTPTPTNPTPTPTNPVTPTPTVTPTLPPNNNGSDPGPAAPGPTATPTVTPVPPSLDSVKVTPASKTLFPGETSKITVKLPAVTEKDVTSVTFTSNKKSIAEVSSDGTITAKSAGTALITTKVTINGSSKDFTTKVTVKKPYISFGNKPVTVYTGTTINFEAKAYGVKDKLTYRVSNTKAASIQKESGLLTAKKTGIIYVTARAGSLTQKIKVTIKKPYISFTRKQTPLKAGESFGFNTKAYGITGKITYRVTDTKIAAINKKTGLLKAKKAGTVYVIAKSGTVTAKYKVSIVE
jgi:lactocepin